MLFYICNKLTFNPIYAIIVTNMKSLPAEIIGIKETIRKKASENHKIAKSSN